MEAMPGERGVSYRVAFACNLAEARAATRLLRTFLAEQGLDDSEQFACELCLAEACNNAVQYAGPGGARQPVSAHAICNHSVVELRVTDHSPGFTLGDRPAALNPERENGRGLFIIQSLMDEVRYYRGASDNTLLMRKTRTSQQHRSESSAADTGLGDARRQLESCQQTIGAMARELCFRSESLAAIFRCCTELGRTTDLEGFGHRLVNDLLHLTAADWFVLRLQPAGSARLEVFAVSSPELRTDPLVLGTLTEREPSAELTAARTCREVDFNGRAPSIGFEPLRAAGPNSRGIVQPLLFGEQLVGTLAIGRRESETTFSVLQAEMIRTFSEFMAVQVVNARNREEQVHARLVAHELDIAHRIQRALLPRSLPQPGGFRLAASWESARQVGGDFYDAIPLGPHSLLLVVADVMGKGVPAAMFATIMRSLLRAMAGRSYHPARLLRRLNDLLHEELSTVGMFITAQLVFVDLERRHLVAASAGHCPVLITSGDTVQTLRVTGTPLGILPHATYRSETATLSSPGGLLLYTDGVTETANAAGEMFGHERLAEWLRARVGRRCSAASLRDELVRELAAFRGTSPLRDDQAFLILAEEEPVTAEVPSPPAANGGRPAAPPEPVSLTPRHGVVQPAV
jgi:serine phosphatase RsbU (regulator of sigma subunit)/anti-sigma regulatory factor (Ser/Thr protein kinase)